jgi:hypothetical protein
MNIRKKRRKINLRELLVEYLSLYTITIVVTVFIQSVILYVRPEILLACLLKSMLTNLITATLVILGLRTEIVKSHILVMAFGYAFVNIPYMDILIIHSYQSNLPFWRILLSYALVYFILGFFIDKILAFSKKVVAYIILHQ